MYYAFEVNATPWCDINAVKSTCESNEIVDSGADPSVRRLKGFLEGQRLCEKCKGGLSEILLAPSSTQKIGNDGILMHVEDSGSSFIAKMFLQLEGRPLFKRQLKASLKSRNVIPSSLCT